jgi:hypothetical protein
MSIDVSLVIVEKSTAIVCYVSPVGGSTAFQYLIYDAGSSLIYRRDRDGFSNGVFEASPEALIQELECEDAMIDFTLEEAEVLKDLYPQDKYRWQYVCS